MTLKKTACYAAAGMAVVTLNACGLKKEKITESKPVKVEVLAVEDRAIGSGRNYSATVVAGDGAQVSFPIPGTVRTIYVSNGQKVTKGQLLAELNAETLENNYNIAKAALDQAQDSYNRFKKLHDAKALADIKWVEVQNALTAAQNSADIARRALADTKLYAPTGGTIANKNIDNGQNVLPAIPVMQIVSLGNVKVAISVPENEISALKEGTKAEITVDALGGETISGTLTEKDVVADPLTRAYTAKFTVDNSTGRLLPGMIASLTLPATVSDSAAIVLPAQAVLLAADNSNFVWLAKNGKAEQRFVRASDITPRGIVIGHGLAAGDSVIIAGMPKVSNGTHVTAE